MTSDRDELIALYATRLLAGGLTTDSPADGLLALALAAAGLPASTSLDDLRAMNLPEPAEETGGMAEEARQTCSELHLPGASGIAARLAGTEHAYEIDKCIRGLIWRDAYDLAIARDRVQLANVPGFDYSEFQEDYENEQRIQERWRATDPRVKEAFANFLRYCSDVMLEPANDGG